MKISSLLATLGILTVSLTGLSAQTQADDLSKYATADALWEHVGDLKKGPRVEPTNREEFVAYVAPMNAAAAEFIKKYPNDPRIWSAKMVEAQSESMLAQAGQAEADGNKMESVAKEIMAAKDAPPEARREAAFVLLQISVGKDPESFDTAVAAYEKQYPNDPKLDGLKLAYAREMEEENPDKAKTMLKELTKSADPRVAAKAKAELAAGDIVGKPVDLKFTAVDGREVDLSKMVGKVVLIDFWATWCGPCMQEVPNVVAAYKKYHDQGFEIVGISLDQSKEKLLEVTKEEGMTWPQYFDGKSWQNEVSQRFGINSIPRMWLVGKDGNLADMNARLDLEGKVEKLLAK